MFWKKKAHFNLEQLEEEPATTSVHGIRYEQTSEFNTKFCSHFAKVRRLTKPDAILTSEEFANSELRFISTCEKSMFKREQNPKRNFVAPNQQAASSKANQFNDKIKRDEIKADAADKCTRKNEIAHMRNGIYDEDDDSDSDNFTKQTQLSDREVRFSRNTHFANALY